MTRYTIDHRAGDHGRGAALVDAAGRRVLGMVGDWAVTNADGRTTLFVVPDAAALVGSTLDVTDDGYPLAEAVMLCLARYQAWRF